MVNFMGTRGGKYPGAGRPKGALAKKNQEVIDRAKAGGIMPIDVLLNDMRLFYSMGEEALVRARISIEKEEKEKALRDAFSAKSVARECAEKVSPYIHPKLSSIQANVTVNNLETALAELE